ncbi:hypothetical protein VKT23_011627 [Stygiomarasmius scandens]|uniref:Uncharacterized protein n=1 Tax=Marasmiellus scandens TaxID=2682957 RepID=A0ABR1JAZ8_9AGAR
MNPKKEHGKITDSVKNFFGGKKNINTSTVGASTPSTPAGGTVTPKSADTKSSTKPNINMEAVDKSSQEITLCSNQVPNIQMSRTI